MSDLIRRQDAIDAIEKLILPQTKGETAAEEINRVAWRCAINCAEELIGHLPSAQPTIDSVEVVHGEWKNKYMDYSFDSLRFECSKCGKLSDGRTKYCAFCGAKMDGKEQNDEID